MNLRENKYANEKRREALLVKFCFRRLWRPRCDSNTATRDCEGSVCEQEGEGKLGPEAVDPVPLSH